MALLQASHSCRTPFAVKSVDFLRLSWSSQLQTQPVSAVFSAMWHLKTYLHSTISQSRLNHVILLSINREEVDSLDIDVIADEFVQGSEHHLHQFGKFTNNA